MAAALFCIVKAMVFPVVMYGCESLDHKGSWALKNWCFWTVVLEKILESCLDSKGIKLVNPNGNQPWTLIGRTDTEVLILWPSDGKSWFTGKDPDAGKDWRQEKGAREDEMVGYHHQLNVPWVCTNSGRQWRTGEPGVLQSMGSQSQTQRSDWTTTTTTQGWETRCPRQGEVRTETLLSWELRRQDPWSNGRSSLYPSRFFWLVWELTWCETD